MDIKYSKEDIALQMELPIEFMDELIGELFSIVDTDIAKLKEAVSKNDSEQISFVLHSIKGAVSNLRMDILSDLIEDQEAQIRDGMLFNNMELTKLENIFFDYKKIML